MRVEIIYFKPSGKYYTTAEFNYDGPWYDVGAHARRLNDERKLPGLNPGDWEGSIYLNSDEAYPMLVNLPPRGGLCAWPGCVQEALCSSGNFGGQLVCSLHFAITNGSAGLTHDEIIVACRNMGINLECGGCASAFYTGYSGDPHDEHCTLPTLTNAADHDTMVAFVKEDGEMTQETEEKAPSPRAYANVTVTFGTVSIPVKLYQAAGTDNELEFHQVNSKTGNRIKMLRTDAVTGDPVPDEQVIKGYEHEPGKLVTFTPAEMEDLEKAAGVNGVVEIREFVRRANVPAPMVAGTLYVRPDKGGERAYFLFAEAMHGVDLVAVGSWTFRGKERLLMLEAEGAAIVARELYYQSELREVPLPSPSGAWHWDEILQARRLILSLQAERFEPGKYEDRAMARRLELVEAKVTEPRRPALAPVVTKPPSNRGVSTKESNFKKKAGR